MKKSKQEKREDLGERRRASLDSLATEGGLGESLGQRALGGWAGAARERPVPPRNSQEAGGTPSACGARPRGPGQPFEIHPTCELP